MGKRKSTVLMVLLTIIIVVLCAITAFPSFDIPGTVKIWNPAVGQYDFGADLGGGYYAYYYPTGVISETEYKELDAEDQESYVQYKNGEVVELDEGETYEAGGLYINNDSVYGIIDDSEDDVKKVSYDSNGGIALEECAEGNGIADSFEEEFVGAVEAISARYAQKGLSDYRVAVVDGLALRIQVPASDATDETTAFENACTTFGLFAETGAMTVTLTDDEISQLDDYELNEIIKDFSVYTAQDVAYLRVRFTSVGRETLDEFAYELEQAEIAASASTSSSSSVEDVTWKIMLGDQAIITLDAETVEQGVITNQYEIRYPLRNISEIGYVESLVILLNSSLQHAEGFDFEFEAIPTSSVRTSGSLYGELTQTLLYVAIFAVIVALIAFSVVTMGRFGIVSAYATGSYLIVAGLCFAFITGGVYEVTLGTALVFVLGLVLMNAMHARTYRAIKAEFANGKTAESAMKGGYEKTLMSTVDVYAVLLLGALALLIGAAGLQTLATQAIICIVTGAFCNLLWTRVINYMFFSASKNKYKYFREVREDNDDE